MPIRTRLAKIGWALSPYKLVGNKLSDEPGIIIGAPHTSNWDFIAFLGVSWFNNVSLKILVKKSWLVGPLGVIGRALGAVAVDRDHPGDLVEKLVGLAKAGHGFKLVIAPEGTRSLGTHWKSGFYRIALDADLPLVLTGIDSQRKEVEVGPTIRLSGDPGADMDRIRAFYSRFSGVNPELRTEPRLRDEQTHHEGVSQHNPLSDDGSQPHPPA